MKNRCHRTAGIIALAASLWIPQGSAESISTLAELRGLRDANLSVIAAMSQAGDQGESVEVEAFLRQEPQSGEPLVDLGSITKFVTAVALLHMVDQGRLDLQARLGSLLPNVPRDKAPITLHQLLTHTSGLVESTGGDEEPLDRATFLARVLAAPLEQEPGTNHLYSNAGYSLLAAIIEVVSGKSYEAYLLEEVLAPRGLTPIGYEAVYDPERSLRSARNWRTFFRRASIRSASWGGHAPGWNLIGNGGAVTTAEGFLQFWNAFLEGRIVGPELVALALTPHADEGGGESHYGYGLVVERSSRFGTVYWHDGGNEVFSAEWRYLGDLKTTLFLAGPGKDAFEGMDLLLR